MRETISITLELCRSKDPDARICAEMLKNEGSPIMRYNPKTALAWREVVNTKLRRWTIIELAKRSVRTSWLAGIASGTLLAALRGDEIEQVIQWKGSSLTVTPTTTLIDVLMSLMDDVRDYGYMSFYAQGDSVNVSMTHVVDGLLPEGYLAFMRTHKKAASEYFSRTSAHNLHEAEDMALLAEGALTTSDIFFGYNVRSIPDRLLTAAVEKEPGLDMQNLFVRMDEMDAYAITCALLKNGYRFVKPAESGRE